MEWDQWLFQRMYRAAGRWARRRSTVPLALLKPELESLGNFALLIHGRGVQVRESEGIGGISIGGATPVFSLPGNVPLFLREEDNRAFYLMRILLMDAMLRGGTVPRALSDVGPDETARRLFPGALRGVLREFPGAKALFAKVKRALYAAEAEDAGRKPARRRPLREYLIGTADAAAVRKLQLETQPNTRTALENERRKGIELETPKDAELLEVDKKAAEDYTLGHSFEKIETLDDFDGAWRDTDDDEDPEELEEALRELQFKHRVRSTDQARSVIEADASPGFAGHARGAGEHAEAIFYDEWDYKKKSYRPAHCRVFEKFVEQGRAGFAARVLTEHRRTYRRVERGLRSVFQDLETVRRIPSGEEPDLDAMVEAAADLRAGRTPSENLYAGRRRRRKDLELHFLLDLSLSTDAWVRGRRVLDVEREALVIFCQALHAHDCKFAIDGFFSRTRNDCEYIRVKDISEPWSMARDRLGMLAPQGYTRIGPALRRVRDRMADGNGRRRWIILFTDGRPNDYDRYEGRYGMEDVRQAVREAEGDGIHLQAFAIDYRARRTLNGMLGPGAFEVLREPGELPEALARFFAILLSS